MATLTERLAVIIEGKAEGLVEEFKKVSKEAEGAATKSGGLQGALDKVGLSGINTGSALKLGLAAGVTVAAAAAVDLGIKGVEAFTGLADQVRHFSQASGASAEESSRFVSVLGQLGIDADAGAAAVGKLARVDPTKLHEFGVEVAKNADGTENLTQTLLNVADAYKRTPDAAARAQLGFAAFGKSYQTLLPLLSQGKEGLQEFFKAADSNAPILHDKDLEQAHTFDVSIQRLHQTFSGLEVELGEALVPALTNLVGAFTWVVHGVDTLLGPIGGLKTIFSAMISPVSLVVSTFKEIVGGSDDAASATGDLGDSAESTQQKIQDESDALDANTKALQAQYDATVAAFDGQIALQDAEARVAQSTTDLSDKQKALADAIKQHGAKSREAADASAALSQAQRDQETSALHAADAAGKLATDQATAAGSADAASAGAAAYRAELGRLRDQAAPGSALRVYLDGVIGQLDTLAAKHPQPTVSINDQATGKLNAIETTLQALSGKSVTASVSVTSSTPSNVLAQLLPGVGAGHASGGPVSAGVLYPVNEHGPEFFKPDVGGTIVPLVGGSGGASGVTVNNTFYVSQELDMQRAADRMAFQIAAKGL